jgi:nucleotide-binding universal stress UspA family protein
VSVIVGFVPTAQGRAAVAAGIEEAKRRGMRLVIVNSMEGDERSERFVDIRDALEELRRELAESGVEHVVHDYARGNSPAEDLVEAVTAEDGELIVIGLRKRTPVGKLVMGSNAQEILLAAPVPVLAVKAAGEGDW